MRTLVTICAFLAVGFTVHADVVSDAINAQMARTHKRSAQQNPQEQLNDVQVQASLIQPPGNFHTVVSGQVYRGARLVTEEEVEWLHDVAGVKTIIDLQGADPWLFSHAGPWAEKGELVSVRLTEAGWATENHMLWVNEPMSSVKKVECHEAREINQILDIIRNPKYQPVFFHCEHGADRTGLIAALYQVFDENPPLSPAAAYQIMEQDGHNHNPIANKFVEAMDQYFWFATTAPMSLDKRDNYKCGGDDDFIPNPVIQSTSTYTAAR